MGNALTIELLAEHQIPEYFRFRGRIFPATQIQLDRARWEWWFRDNPQVHDRAILTRVILENGEIVGSISTVPQRLQVGASVVTVASRNDFFVDPTRRLGLMALRLYRADHDQYEVNIGANISDSARRLLLKLNYIDLSDQLCEATAYFPSNLGAEVSGASRVKQYGLRLWRKILSRSTLEFAVSDSISEMAQNLWERISTERDVCFVKDLQYLRWRYEACPSTRFRFVHVMAGSVLTALAVVVVVGDRDDIAPGARPAPRGIIMDLLAPPNDAVATFAAVNACLEFFEKQGCGSCSTHFLDYGMLRHFIRMGFDCRPSSVGLLVHTNRNRVHADAAVTNPQRWSFWIGDTDLY